MYIVRKLTGCISTLEMNNLLKELNLKLLENRRKYFMLNLMYKLSKEEDNIERYRPEMLLRTGPNVKMEIAFTNKERVLHCPFYLCNRLWGKLNSNVQLAETAAEFKSNLNKIDLADL